MIPSNPTFAKTAKVGHPPILGKFPTRYVSRIPTVQETMDLRALS
jgi:hypothetical protein